MEKISQEVLTFQIENALKMKVSSLIFIANGISNYNYLVNKQTVIKIKEPKLAKFNSLVLEKQIATALFELNLTPRHHFYPELIAVDYLPNIENLTKENYQLYLSQLISAIQAIHDLKIETNHHFNMFDRLDYYKKEAGITTSLPDEQKVIDTAKAFYQASPKTMAHNDLVNGNILIDNHHIKLIDFEYCGLNDPDFDVVSFLSENAFVDDEVKAHFIAEYYQNRPLPERKLNAYFQFADILWYYWALFAYRQTKRAIFLEIAQVKKSNDIC